MLSAGSGNTVIKSKLISRRMFLLSVGKAVVLVGVLGRLISLQINESKKYKTLSDKNRFREWKLAPERGIIKDYFNEEIASNKQVYQIHLIPENTRSIEEVFFRLKTILNINDKKIFSLKRKIAKQKPWEPIIVSDNLNWSEFSRINLFLGFKKARSTWRRPHLFCWPYKRCYYGISFRSKFFILFNSIACGQLCEKYDSYHKNNN